MNTRMWVRGRSSWIFAAISAAILVCAYPAFAATTSPILPTSDGNYTQWTPSVGTTTHYTMVDEAVCNGTTDYNSTTVATNRDSYGVSLAAVPNAARITQIAIKPCASRASGGGTNPVMNIFYRADGINSADSGSYSLTGTTPTELATTTYSGLSFIKGATTTLETGAVLTTTSGAHGARLSRIATTISYTPITVPTSLAGTATTTSAVGLTWTATTTGVTGYGVERSTDGVNWTAIASTSAIGSYYDSGLASGTLYYHRVRAFNSGGYSSYSNTATTTTLVSPPTAPSGLTATATTSSAIGLTWTDNSSNETAFTVERSTNGINFSGIATTSANVTAYYNSGLTASTTYFYRVRAFNSAGYSSFSSTTSATTKDTLPTAPSSLTSVATTTSAMALSWSDNSTNETAFAVERSTDLSNWLQIASTSAHAATGTTSYYYAGGLSPNTVYYHRVRAYNSVGYSSYSNTSAATTTDTAPAAPSGLSLSTAPASATTTDITLDWIDNSSNELGFLVERDSGGGFIQIATTSANAVSYLDAAVPGGTYTYKVRAYNSAGYSSYSNTASTTVPLPIPAPVAYWKLDESSGDATDATGNGYTLINYGTTTYATGLINNDADFGTANTDKSLRVGSTLGIISSSSMSISGWVKLNTEITSDPTYTFMSQSFQSPASVVTSIQYQYNGGSPRLDFARGRQGLEEQHVYYPVSLGTSNWYYLASTYDGTTLTAYINGAAVGSTTISGDGNSTGYIDEFAVGNGGYDAQYASAQIDEVGVWAQSLSVSDISTLYNSGTGRQYPF